MNPLARLEEHLKHLSSDKVETILEIRNIVAKVCPQAVERLDRKGITYYDARRGGPVKAGICQILFNSESLSLDFIRLDFIHGAFLPDPARLLKGDNLAKWGLDLGPYDTVPWEEVTALIEASARFDPASLVIKGADGLTPLEKLNLTH